VVDGLAGLAVLGDLRTLLTQPGPQRYDEWTAALTAHIHALLRRQAVDLALDRKQRIDARHGFLGDRRLVDARKIKELAPPVRPARCFHDRPRLAASLVEPVEPRISIGLHQPGIARQMLLRVLATAITRIEERSRRRLRPRERPVIAHIGPQSTCARLALGQN